MTELNFQILFDDKFVDAASGLSVVPTHFDMETNGAQLFAVFHDPDMRPDRLTMRHCEHPNYQPKDLLPNHDPNRHVIFQSSRRIRIFEFWFYWGKKENGVLPLFLEVKGGVDRARSSLATAITTDAPTTDITGIIAYTFKHYRPRGTAGAAARIQLIAGDEDAQALWELRGPRIRWLHNDGILVAEKVMEQ